MFRFIDLHLQAWVKDPHRKPLLLRGARQVGKTFAVRKLGQAFSQFTEVNFEESPQLKRIFADDQDLDPQRIVRDLSLALKVDIRPGETLLFFDEIQEAPQAIIALRYFYEKMPQLHVIAAGSLLDFAIEEVGVPVGRVDFMHLYPMSWLEFLKALGYDAMITAILNHDVHKAESEVVHDKCLALLSEYCAIGGMPQVVAAWASTQDPAVCSKMHHSIINAYRDDFRKYAKQEQVKYVDLLFEHTLKQLGQKFKFSHLEGEYRSRELSPALDLLEKARVAYRIRHASGQGIPLGAEASDGKYKVIFLDIGLSQALLGLDLADWFLNSQAAFINKGAIVEAFVGQELLAYSNPYQQSTLYYWQREAKGSEAELDYLIVLKGQVVPIEVKSDKGRGLKSMRLFLDSHPKTTFGIRYSTHNYSVHEKILSFPLYTIPLSIHWQVPAGFVV